MSKLLPFIFFAYFGFVPVVYAAKSRDDWMLDTVKGLVCKRDYSEQETVLFSANLVNNLVTTANQRLVFADVKVNEGNGYDPISGVFTCKVPGLYQFTWMIHQTSGPAGLHVKLFHNKNVAFWTYISLSNGNLPGTTYLNLKAGDTVWLRADQAGRKLCGANHSMFSGMLMNM